MSTQPDSSEKKPGRPPSLSAKAILKTARELRTDELSMSAVARKMGVPVTSLYRHFSSKEKLYAALAQEVLDMFKLPDPAPHEWRDWLMESGLRLRKLMLQNPILFSSRMQRNILTGAIGEFYEPVFLTLEDAGFSTTRSIEIWSGVGAIAGWMALRETDMQRNDVSITKELSEAISELGSDASLNYPRLIQAIPAFLSIDIEQFHSNVSQTFINGIEDPR
ncbi:TetR/AcrR family transcriptional regulator [Parasphingorhabdus sp.]|uniref:TetR/AcrR family transcriptional regulator n=1 Tax=Parasphingorhabdus sp. TaxID=2709688 RepID=UPI0032EBA086